MKEEFVKALAEAEEIWEEKNEGEEYDITDLLPIAQSLFLANYIDKLTEGMKQVSADIKKFTESTQVEVPEAKTKEPE